MPPRFRTLQIPSSEGGGVDNFCILGPSEVSDSAQSADLELTADILGRSRGRDFNLAATGPFFKNSTTNLGQSAPHFVRNHIDAQNCMVCGLGVDNFGASTTFLGRPRSQIPSVELTTGPFFTNRHEFASHTTFQKQQKCNSPVFAGVWGPPWKTVAKKSW